MRLAFSLRRLLFFALRALLMLLALENASAAMANEAVPYAKVTPNPTLTFPRDHGAHPAFRTEWWYVTGHVQTATGKPLGFQVTFFRSNTGIGESISGTQSRFKPSQILFAHAAIADVSHGKLRHDDRIARQGFGDASSTETLDIRLDKWTMKFDGAKILTRVQAKDFAFDFTFTPTQPPLLQGEKEGNKEGDGGFSRKGPGPDQASYYVSLPQLSVDGRVEIAGKSERVYGKAWFDHEWSSEIMSDETQGWDWLGANFDDGGTLMAFQMRGKQGDVLWAAGTRVKPNGGITRLGKDEVAFTPLRTWPSPRTGARWPVAMRLRAGTETFELKPWMDDQELDSARTTGITYWEGAVDVMQQEKKLGRGYLELTGYAKPIKF
jgi:predicted secreted hydrolase